MSFFSAIKRSMNKTQSPLRRSLKNPFREAAEICACAAVITTCGFLMSKLAPGNPMSPLQLGMGFTAFALTPLLLCGTRDSNAARIQRARDCHRQSMRRRRTAQTAPTLSAT